MRFFMKYVVMSSALLLMGCMATGLQVVEGNDRSVIINWANASSVDGALALADQHCSQFGRDARFSGKVTDFQLAYDCI
jgi:hypothetical protein